MLLQEAINTYHELLTDELAQASEAQLNDQLRRRGLYFGDRPLCTVLRPRFFTPRQYSFLRARVQIILSAFDKAYRAGMADPEFLKQFRLDDWEHELIQHDPGYRSPTPVSRLDAFFVTNRDELRFTEYNAEVPAASAYSDAFTNVFLGLPIMREFMRRYEVRNLSTRHHVMHALLDAYQQWLGRAEKPTVAILDWHEVPTYSEFRLFLQYFESQGITCQIVDPREVEYRQGKLYAGDFAIDLIYKRVLITELIQRGGMDHPVVQAVRNNNVCMVNPFRCKILYKKTSLAVLSDERNQHLFDEPEQRAIDDHIPWTRTVEERHTVHEGQPVDLIPYVLKYRERFVLKPSDEYGGKGIVLGWLVDDNQWEQAITAGLETPHIIQERVDIPWEPYPSLVDGRVQISNRMLDTAPFAFYGEYMDGCLTRLGTDPLLNVTAGGGSSVPTFVVQKR
jgi:glutathionylspermidine synthase